MTHSNTSDTGCRWVTAHSVAIRIIAGLIHHPGSLSLTGNSTVRLALPNGQRFRITVTEEERRPTHDQPR